MEMLRHSTEITPWTMLCTFVRGWSRSSLARPFSSSRIKIYTKTGDAGQSSLFNGERRSKTDYTFEALGDVDELNASIGLAVSFLKTQPGLTDQLTVIQSALLDVGSAVATPLQSSTAERLHRSKFDPLQVDELEKWIDAMDADLPPLKNFILPGGGLASSALHVSRTVCRRAERRVVALSSEGHVEADVARYLNRLSDYLFTAARMAAMLGGEAETVYKKPKTKPSESGVDVNNNECNKS